MQSRYHCNHTARELRKEQNLIWICTKTGKAGNSVWSEHLLLMPLRRRLRRHLRLSTCTCTLYQRANAKVMRILRGFHYHMKTLLYGANFSETLIISCSDMYFHCKFPSLAKAENTSGCWSRPRISLTTHLLRCIRKEAKNRSSYFTSALGLQLFHIFAHKSRHTSP